jgi:hypothetical protein
MGLKRVAIRLVEALRRARLYIRLTPEERHLVDWYAHYLRVQQGGGISLKQKSCRDAGGSAIPWMTYSAIEYLKQFDLSDRTVLEFGSGSSTEFWASRAKQVTSVENDRAWYDIQRGRLRSNIELIFAETAEEYISPESLGHQIYDIVVIDGRYRFDCAAQAVNWVTSNGVVILDNSDWHPNTAAMLARNGFLQVDFVGPGPLNAYAWATSFFFRPDCFLQIVRSSSAPVVIGGLKYVSDEDKSLVNVPETLKGLE